MTDGKPEELSPEEQHQQDQARVQGQLGAIDITQRVSSIMSGFFGSGGGPGPFARTSFEGHDLNAMIDLVETANPADLENAGTALWKARDALADAAQELQDYVDKVEWKGQSGDEFRSFGRGLAEHARGLGAFADVAATQITAAGTGLASVHKSMPPRDTRLRKQSVEDIEIVKQVDGNPDYEAAKKVERDRQEAINQMNRLASFYAVSEETLAAQEPPRFDRVLQANVPPPSTVGPVVRAKSARDVGDGPSDESEVSSVSARSDSLGDADRSQRDLDTARPITPAPERETSVEIDNVVAPPAPQALPDASTLPSSTGGPGSGGGTVPPPAGGPANLVSRGGPGAKGPQGYAKSVGQSTGSLGKGGGPAGRAPTASGGSGTAGRPGTLGGGAGAAGRAGASGAGGTGQTPAGRAGAGRGNGIVGGNPQRAAGSTGSRMPRGNVIGGEGAASGRATGGRTGRGGVVGANPANTPRSGARGTASTNGVVGTPRGAASRSRPGAGFTQGGSGLVRGPGGRRPEEEEQDDAVSRPDYLTEDEETWTAGRRPAGPPVID
ncbi:hypothetical protein [Streptomyces sp. NPDC088261]|uniref:hypothetical protein n=1 Tax=Streptomyces sp. NPDC088261 TaxID=3365851 RepID=UPI003810E2A7